ncbi:MAG: hypothetical protein HQM09_17560 [Candidatus Riflebacteria bacterium]|nr:hypothetical protein [Candidatus Riflebacteria bacterium]
MTLRDELLKILPDILPEKPIDAITGSALCHKVRTLIGNEFADSSIRQYLSELSQDLSTPIAKVDQGIGYYRRSAEKTSTLSDKLATSPDGKNIDNAQENHTEIPEEGRKYQREEKFRAFFARYEEYNNRFPMIIEHTKGKKNQPVGLNRWKYPDLAVLQWDVGETTDSGFKLSNDLLEVKRSLGEQPFRISSIELKVALDFFSFRQDFFQCVSNSKWSHNAMLIVAEYISDQMLAEELRRLGTSYDVSVISFGISSSMIDSWPNSQELLRLSEEDFEKIYGQISISLIVVGKSRETLDWEAIRDLQNQNPEFKSLFKWIAKCLDDKKAFRYQDYLAMEALNSKY